MDNTLQHHGILGMRWGVRRYQNADGTLTEAGKKRYGNTGEVSQNPLKSNSNNSETSSKKTDTSKKVAQMTDAELKEAVSRLQMEKQYKDLMASVEGQQQVSKGKKITSEILESATKTVGTQVATYTLGSLVNKMLGSNVVNVKNDNKENNKNSSSIISKLTSTDSLSDKELKDVVTRLNMEKLYKDLTSKKS